MPCTTVHHGSALSTCACVSNRRPINRLILTALRSTCGSSADSCEPRAALLAGEGVASHIVLPDSAQRSRHCHFAIWASCGDAAVAGLGEALQASDGGQSASVGATTAAR
jgi:hypothetical protein